MCVASSAAAVHQFSSVSMGTSQLHARRAHARKRKAHTLVYVVHGLEKSTEVTSCCTNHFVVATKKRYLIVYSLRTDVKYIRII